jgi:hypothetical protein
VPGSLKNDFVVFAMGRMGGCLDELLLLTFNKSFEKI